MAQSHQEHYAQILMNPPEHTTLLQALPFPGVAVIMGRKRRGKSALAHAIAEKLQQTRHCQAVLHLPTATKGNRRDYRSCCLPGC